MYHSVSAFGSSIGTEILSSFGAAMVGVYCGCCKLTAPPKYPSKMWWPGDGRSK